MVMRFKAFCAENRVIACLLATLLLSSAFILFPGIDLAISRQFYVPGIGFPLAHSGLLQDVRMAGSNIPVTVAVVVFAALVLKLLHPLRPCLLPPRFALYFASLYLLGPVLLVNGLLKTFWGRPRPVKVEEFGGSVPFLDAWSRSPDYHRIPVVVASGNVPRGPMYNALVDLGVSDIVKKPFTMGTLLEAVRKAAASATA